MADALDSGSNGRYKIPCGFDSHLPHQEKKRRQSRFLNNQRKGVEPTVGETRVP